MKKNLILLCSLVAFLTLACSGKRKPCVDDFVKVADSIKYPSVDNYLVGKTYLESTNYEKDKYLSTQLLPLDKMDKGSYTYGIHVNFIDSVRYRRFYTAPCGNDCFFTENGRYYLSASDTLVIVPDSTIFTGDCSFREVIYGSGVGTKYYIQLDSITGECSLSSMDD